VGLLALVLLSVEVPVRAQIYTQQVRFGSRGEGNGQFRAIEDIALDGQGNVYVADGYRVQKFSNSGKFLRKFGSQGNGNGQFKPLHGTGGVAVDQAGNIYISDRGNNRVQKFDRDGRFVSTFGTPGNGNGQFKHPGPLAVDRTGNVYVIDTGNYRVQKFDGSGRFLLKFGRGDGWQRRDRQGRLTLADGMFLYPSDIAVDVAGNVYVAEKLRRRIQKFSSTGKFLGKFGSQPSGYEDFEGTTKIAVDSIGNVYVADRPVRIFHRNGKLISQFNTANTGHKGSVIVSGIGVDTKGNVFVAYQDNDGTRVHKFRRRYLAP
jgi:sugar lactone lactonase YvrE